MPDMKPTPVAMSPPNAPDSETDALKMAMRVARSEGLSAAPSDKTYKEAGIGDAEKDAANDQALVGRDGGGAAGDFWSVHTI